MQKKYKMQLDDPADYLCGNVSLSLFPASRRHSIYIKEGIFLIEPVWSSPWTEEEWGGGVVFIWQVGCMTGQCPDLFWVIE